MNSIFKRRSCRSFVTKPIGNKNIDLLLSAAMQAPSACNTQPWEFIVVTNKETLKDISKFHPHAQMCLHADAAIVVLAVPGAQGDISQGFFPQDCAAATQNILLQATEIGIGSVWCGIYPKESIVFAFRDYFNLPAGLIPFSLVVLGYPKEAPKPTNRFDASKVHINQF